MEYKHNSTSNTKLWTDSGVRTKGLELIPDRRNDASLHHLSLWFYGKSRVLQDSVSSSVNLFLAALRHSLSNWVRITSKVKWQSILNFGGCENGCWETNLEGNTGICLGKWEKPDKTQPRQSNRGPGPKRAVPTALLSETACSTETSTLTIKAKVHGGGGVEL